MNFDLKGLDLMLNRTSSLSINLGLKNTFLLGFDYGFMFLDANGEKIGKLNDLQIKSAIEGIVNGDGNLESGSLSVFSFVGDELKSVKFIAINARLNSKDNNGAEAVAINDYSQLAIKAILNVVYENQIK
ncbi:MAG: hypothetical protein ACI9XP_001427 [Lentimonas sp.]|jgi:hypothetical protein